MSMVQAYFVELIYIDPRVNSDKFYRIYVVDNKMVTQYGRNGAFGTFGTKSYPSPAAAEAAGRKQRNAKRDKGYQVNTEGTITVNANYTDTELDQAGTRLVKGIASPAPVNVDPPTADTKPQPEPTAAQQAIYAQVVCRLLDAGFDDTDKPASVFPGMDAPMLAQTVAADDLDSLLADERWGCQNKLDGERVLIEVVDGHVTARNRSGAEKVRNISADHLAPFTSLIEGRWEFDGELVGRTLWLFDMPCAGGFFAADTPFEDRYKALLAVFGAPGAHSENFGVVATVTGETAKRQLLADVEADHREGIMFRDMKAPYEHAMRSSGLRKHKLVKDADVVVAAVNTTKQSVDVAVYNTNGHLQTVGAVSTIGKGTVEVGDVVTVRYLYVVDEEHPRLFQPRIVTVREDKLPEYCTIDQFSGAATNKTVNA